MSNRQAGTPDNETRGHRSRTGGIIPEQNKSVALESTDAKADGKVLGTHRDVRVEVEDARTQGNVSIKGVRVHATTHARSMTTADENDQYHAPEKPPTPPAHLMNLRNDTTSP